VSASLRFVLVLMVLGALSAPIAYGVLYEQDARDARTTAEQMTGGDSKAGEALVTRYGCAGCHQIQQVMGAAGQVGPSLVGVAGRATIAGRLVNEPDQMILWLRHPQAVVPGNGMPDQGIGEREARDIAAYLYTLRKAS
jgi:cytochrome c2